MSAHRVGERPLSGRPPTGLHYRLRTQTSENDSGASSVEISTSKCALNPRPHSAKPMITPSPPSIPSRRTPTKSLRSLRPQSAKAVISTRPEVVKNEVTEKKLQRDQRTVEIPECLQPFEPYRTESYHHCTGLTDSIECLIYLPSLKSMDQLPTLPKPQQPQDQLKYHSILPRKVSSTAVVSNGAACNHRSKLRTAVVSNGSPCNHPSKIRLYDENGRVVYERYHGTRSSGIVNKEIENLERLMQGLSIDSGWCLVVSSSSGLISADKNVDVFSTSSDDFKASPRLSSEPREASDSDEVVQFIEDYEQIMDEMRHQHRLCLKELSLIELNCDDGPEFTVGSAETEMKEQET